jgi:hypothetical protein
MKRDAIRTSKSNRTKSTGRSPSRPSARLSGKGEGSDDIDTLVATNAQALGIFLEPGWHDAITFNLRLILQHAKFVDEFALADDIEPASVFYA